MTHHTGRFGSVRYDARRATIIPEVRHFLNQTKFEESPAGSRDSTLHSHQQYIQQQVAMTYRGNSKSPWTIFLP